MLEWKRTWLLLTKMRVHNLKAGDPLSLTIAADARLTSTNFLDDQIWELNLTGREPAAVALETTYGLRVSSMRIFPRFIEGHTSLTDPNQFTSPPIVRHFLPNFLEITFEPFTNIKASLQYWAIHSEAIAGRIRILNSGTKPRQIRLEWSAILTPVKGSQLMAPIDINSAAGLAGNLEDLAPVVFITGGAVPVTSPFPALVLGLDLAPGQSRFLTWSQAACRDIGSSSEMVQSIIERNWEAESARMELQNTSMIELHTGNHDWDAAFAFSQKSALGLFHSSDGTLPYPSFVIARNPDKGFSFSGDGVDYDQLWNGQTPMDSYYLANILLTGAPDLIQGLIFNFLSTQNDQGEIDLKPGFAGHRSSRLATPLLANLCWQIYQRTGDRHFIEQVFDPLMAFIDSWFSEVHDRDRDGIPEWDHPAQTGFDDHPLFSRWRGWSQGVDITTAECPSLSAFLYRECQALIRMSQLLCRDEVLATLETHVDCLKTAVDSSWADRAASYQYRDRDAHNSQGRQKIGERFGSGTIEIKQDYNEPIRLVVSIIPGQETTVRPEVFIHGMNATGSHRIERISSERILWFPGWGTSTSEKTYASIDYIEILGLGSGDEIQIHSAGFDAQDLTNLIPLWAGMAPEKKARRLVRATLTKSNRYWREFGLPARIPNRRRPSSWHYQQVNLSLCVLLGEGLLAYGYRSEAAELLTRLMNVIVRSLKKEACFRQQYHATTGEGLGERNALMGLAPIGLFLEILGVHLFSPTRVMLDGINPFPWPVTVKYLGLTILRGQDKTQVIFPDGQTVSVPAGEHQLVALE